jgi:hypothetical protein
MGPEQGGDIPEGVVKDIDKAQEMAQKMDSSSTLAASFREQAREISGAEVKGTSNPLAQELLKQADV